MSIMGRQRTWRDDTTTRLVRMHQERMAAVDAALLLAKNSYVRRRITTRLRAQLRIVTHIVLAFGTTNSEHGTPHGYNRYLVSGAIGALARSLMPEHERNARHAKAETDRERHRRTDGIRMENALLYASRACPVVSVTRGEQHHARPREHRKIAVIAHATHHKDFVRRGGISDIPLQPPS